MDENGLNTFFVWAIHVEPNFQSAATRLKQSMICVFFASALAFVFFKHGAFSE
jgi:hypothetical protein